MNIRRALPLSGFAALSLGMAVGVGICFATAPAVMAQGFAPPPGLSGGPGGREGGGTRGGPGGGCAQGTPNRLLPLVPQSNVGLTTEEYPRFFWFMPRTVARTAQFSLYEGDATKADRKLLYSANFGITGEPGIASLALPASAAMPPLVPNQVYSWTVTLVCDPDRPSATLLLNSRVLRVSPDVALTRQVAQSDDRTRAALYARNGIWFDALMTLANLRCTNPSDPTITQRWTEFLNSVALQPMVNQPFLGACPAP